LGGDISGKDAHAQLPRKSWLANQQQRQRRLSVHVRAGHEAQFLELFRIEKLCLIHQEDDTAAAFVLFGCQ
jgi:hypothetical protein